MNGDNYLEWTYDHECDDYSFIALKSMNMKKQLR